MSRKLFGSLEYFAMVIKNWYSGTVPAGVWSPSTISNACQLPGFREERGIGILSTRRRPEGSC